MGYLHCFLLYFKSPSSTTDHLLWPTITVPSSSKDQPDLPLQPSTHIPLIALSQIPNQQAFSLNTKVTPVRETSTLTLDLYLSMLLSESPNLVPKSNAQLCNRPAPAASSSALSLSPKEHMDFPKKLFSPYLLLYSAHNSSRKSLETPWPLNSGN